MWKRMGDRRIPRREREEKPLCEQRRDATENSSWRRITRSEMEPLGLMDTRESHGVTKWRIEQKWLVVVCL